MNRRNDRTFGQVIRERRRRLDLAQHEVARRIGTSTPYVGHLESGKRHPSDKVLSRLAEVLGLERRELFFLANPDVVELLGAKELSSKRAAWDEFRKDERMRRLHKITAEEMNMLAQVASIGDVGNPRDFIYILNAVRQVLRR